MGNYVNPGNSGFTRIRKDVYVDKYGLIELINQTVDTTRCLTCVSRPRRFGKAFAAQILCSYYDKTGDSAGLLVPVWDFFGEYENDFGEGEKTGGTLVREEYNSFLTINAVDGTVVNRESGY